VEAADWIVWQLCGTYVRNICTAGYKAVYQDGRYPSREFLAALDERFAGFFDDKVAQPLAELGTRAGGLTEQAARWTGLRPGTAVAVGNVDAHVTVPAAQSVEPGQMLAVMGTSTCHVMNSDTLGEVPGMCGVVRDGITPGLWGYEAGQSGVGDIFAWFVRTSVPAEYAAAAAAAGQDLHTYLTELSMAQEVGAHGLVALDWHNGNRSVLVDHELSGLVVGLTLATRPEEVYRALLEATAFGTRRIVEAFESAGVPVAELTAAGGLVRNGPLMQLYADITRRDLAVVGSAQGPALGSAIHAAVAAGAYPDVQAAAAAMGRRQRAAYRPDPARSAAYDPLYQEYVALHDYFGRGGNDVMHRLREIRRKARAQ
jgi:L-ribulokinase